MHVVPLYSINLFIVSQTVRLLQMLFSWIIHFFSPASPIKLLSGGKRTNVPKTEQTDKQPNWLKKRKNKQNKMVYLKIRCHWRFASVWIVVLHTADLNLAERTRVKTSATFVFVFVCLKFVYTNTRKPDSCTRNARGRQSWTGVAPD